MGMFARLFGRKAPSPGQVPPSPEVPRSNPEWTPPPDETIRPGEVMTKVVSESDLAPGAVIRVWHEYLHQWIPGWWMEVVRIAEGRVHLKDLKSGEETKRYPEDTIGSAWKHPAPDRLKLLGERAKAGRDAALSELRARYERLDFGQASEEDMIGTLRKELAWKDANKSRYYDMKEEFEIHDLAVTRVGEELDRRGGMALMSKVCTLLGSPRGLDMSWNGIGEWRG